MAFLQRVFTGGGRIDPSYAIGSKRLDLCVAHHGDKFGIEVKIWRSTDNAKGSTVDGRRRSMATSRASQSAAAGSCASSSGRPSPRSPSA
jgi:hypothetical protein